MKIYLQERAPRTLDELSKIAEQYFKARNRQLHQKIKFEVQKYKTENPNNKKMNEETNDGKIKGSNESCQQCKKQGHRTEDCFFKKPSAWNVNLKCFVWGRTGHLQKDSYTKKPGIAGAAVEEEPAMEKCSVAQVLPQDVNEADRIEECIVVNKLLLANGTSVNIVVNVCQQKSTENTMSVLLGLVGNRQVRVLRDIVYCGVVVKGQFVEKEQYLGMDGYMMMMEKTKRKAPLARIITNTIREGRYSSIVPTRFNI